MNRRYFIIGIFTAIAASVTSKAMGVNMFGRSKISGTNFPYTLSEEEWRKKLTPEQYKVLRKAGTEPSRSSPLNDESNAGVFHCAGCDHKLYSSEDKFESGTGWPSFTQPINKAAIATSVDNKLFFARTEVHCANCGGHIGHVFTDGPKPTGMRYCMNGIAMTFKSA